MTRLTSRDMAKTAKKNSTIQGHHFKTRESWRQWLQKNHEKEKSVWLIFYHKKSNTAGITQEQAVEEALCFGWIDSKSIKRDHESRYQYFSPRKRKSAWSRINRDRVKKLIAAGLMTPAGQALIDLAKETGTWEAMVDVENGVIPDDLMKQFSRNKTAFKKFQSFAPSAQKVILAWIMMAKRPETRKQRIEKTVKLATKNLKAYP